MDAAVGVSASVSASHARLSFCKYSPIESARKVTWVGNFVSGWPEYGKKVGEVPS